MNGHADRQRGEGVKGDLKNKEAVSAAIRKAEFTSLRGDFKFNVNG